MNNLETQKWIERQNKTWKKEGSVLRKKRKDLEVKVKDIASLLCVSESRFYSLEVGRPVSDAVLLRNSYNMALEKLTGMENMQSEANYVYKEENTFTLKVLKNKLQEWIKIS
ncbi:hypothetical protein AA0X95_11080 [Bacillus sp. 1P10SD]|uniref:hypothetical protein n=1 Tax=Bacillus sp. 1P10SD TaxID=3132265 RepID=UPI0039A67C5D